MDKNYKDLFFGETQEYLNQINGHLVELEKNPSRSDVLQEIFRLMHTLKGMAATMGYVDLARLSHSIEDIFDELRSGGKKLNASLMDSVFSSIDVMNAMLEELERKGETTVSIDECLLRLSQASQGSKEMSAKGNPAQGAGEQLTSEELQSVEEKIKEGYQLYCGNVCITADCAMKGARAFLVLSRLKHMGSIIKSVPDEQRLEKSDFQNIFHVFFVSKEDSEIIHDELSRVSEIEWVTIEPYETNVNVKEKKSTRQAAPLLKKIQSMRINVDKLDSLMNLIGELSIAKSRLMESIQSKNLQHIEDTTFILDRLVSSLQDEVLQMRLLPISYILDAFPRVVRDIVRNLNKEVELEILGSEIELDRVILDEIGGPLMHVVRNSLDHGIEERDIRLSSGKPERGMLSIKVSRERGHVVIEISDDGRGIDFNELGRKAVEKGIISESDIASIDNKKALEIMTTPSFSTTSDVTDISGRGVGLDAVKVKLEYLGGRLDFETEVGKGSTFILTLPLTLAIIKAMLVKVADEIFAIPLMNIRETLTSERDAIKTIQGSEVIRVRDEVIPLVRLERELELDSLPSEKSLPKFPVVIVEGRRKYLGLMVNKIIGEQDIVVKPLGSLVRQIKGMAGAAILGDGRVALILDVMNLL